MFDALQVFGQSLEYGLAPTLSCDSFPVCASLRLQGLELGLGRKAPGPFRRLNSNLMRSILGSRNQMDCA